MGTNLFLLVFLVIWSYSQCQEIIQGEWNRQYHEVSGRNSSLTIFRFPVLKNKLVARVAVECDKSTSQNPMLVVFREKTAILSLQVPTIVQNYEYNKVERTLCPFANVEKNEILTVEISSFSPVPYSFKAFEVEKFQLEINETREVKSSASEPIYFQFDIPEGLDSVVVHVSSNSSVCSTVSIQPIGCPVFDLANNVVSTGSHQTMTKSASIVVERVVMKSFYVIFVVNPNDNLCSEMQDIEPIHPSKAQVRSKWFNVTIESAASVGDYVLPIGITAFVIMFVYFISITYIIFDNKAESQFLRDSYVILEEDRNYERIRQRVQEEIMLDDPDLADYDILIDCHDKYVIRAKAKLKVSDLSIKDWKARERKYNIYWITLVTIGLFYGLPVVQLVLTWQNTVRLSGDLDLCWYNFRCARPYLGFFAFNNLVSNSGYVFFGLLLIIINKQRESRYKAYRQIVPRLEDDYGLPQHGGLMTAIGIAVVMEGIMSASYHICPSSSNYQFDTSFMYVIGMLGILKLYQLRHPDINANAHVAFAVVAAFILIAMGGVYLHNLAFWAIFAVVYMFTILAVSVEFYFKGIWKLNFREQYNTFRYSYAASKRCSFLVPAYLGRFCILTLANLINFTFLIYGVIHRPRDFASFLLLPFIANLFLYLIYYMCMKVGYREAVHPRGWMLLLFATISWAISGYFFLHAVSDWSKAPASSRELNSQCLIMQFYDNHDMWHFFSSLAIFFSFILINRIDDDLMLVPRDNIVVF